MLTGFITLFLNRLGMSEVLIIALVVLLLFGGRKIPELMRGIGRGVRSFKQGLNDAVDEAAKTPGKDGGDGDDRADAK